MKAKVKMKQHETDTEEALKVKTNEIMNWRWLVRQIVKLDLGLLEPLRDLHVRAEHKKQKKKTMCEYQTTRNRLARTRKQVG